MITFFQEREIEKYLTEKKISGELFTEIKDHMVSQITDIQNYKNLNFEESFEATKAYWSKDLALVRKNIFSRQKITKIAYKMDRTTNRNLFLKSLLCALLFVGFEIILTFVLNENLYVDLYKIIKVLFFFLPFAIVGMYIRQKSLENKYYRKNIMINNFVHPLFVFVFTVFVDNLVDLPKNSYILIYNFINFGSQGEITASVFTKSLLAGILFFTLYSFSYFSLNENIRRFKRLQKTL
ncbi:hypothetical protein BN1195_03211 [Chryseobacterium oranimense G311]|uniref:hypothetical protein n=1 Tax=Chryseobacterium oranimense TaxID=421058 RepID=UPI0005338307|nr:hypothetical protein [Chryseobacterium oranimense]CEJ70872.1 hypothetical protein BN1195_03211 [Chryseobacterium oranimense G311]